ncbi:MAG: hypothetical protein AAGM04_04760 [Pseudomonadota bacterium]
MKRLAQLFAFAISFATALATLTPAQAASFRAPVTGLEMTTAVPVHHKRRRRAAVVGGLIAGAIIGAGIARGHRRYYRGRYYRGRYYKRRYYRGHRRYYRGRYYRRGFNYGGRSFDEIRNFPGGTGR